jgi:membrane-bound lytic murein transglycosylase B
LSLRVAHPWFVAVFLAIGCSRKSPDAVPDAAMAPTAEAAAAPTKTDYGPQLAELTQAVRKYGFEKQKVATSLDELVDAGYLPSKPVAPAGRSFSIDPKKMQVTLSDN